MSNITNQSSSRGDSKSEAAAGDLKSSTPLLTKIKDLHERGKHVDALKLILESLAKLKGLEIHVSATSRTAHVVFSRAGDDETLLAAFDGTVKEIVSRWPRRPNCSWARDPPKKFDWGWLKVHETRRSH